MHKFAIGSLRKPSEKNEALFETKNNWKCFFKCLTLTKCCSRKRCLTNLNK